MNFKDFSANARKIYGGISAKRDNEGPLPTSPSEGVLVAYRHPSEVIDSINDASRGAAKIVPAIVYDSPDIHTTVSYNPMSLGGQEAEELVKRLIGGLDKSFGDMASPRIDFNEQGWLVSRDSVIAGGVPLDGSFTGNYSLLADALGSDSIKSPWGAHITVSRFKDGVDRENISRLVAHLSELRAPPASEPEGINVGFYSHSQEDGIRFDVQKSFDF